MKKITLLMMFLMLSVGIMASKKHIKIYHNPNYAKHPFKGIKRIAILPFITQVPENKLSIEQINQIRFNKGIEYQTELYSYQMKKEYLNNKMQNVKIINVELIKDHITIDSLVKKLPSTICKILNVDAVIIGSVSYHMDRKRKNNVIHLVLSFYNKDNDLIWQFSRTDLKTRLESLDDMIKNSMQRFPKEKSEEPGRMKALFSKKK